MSLVRVPGFGFLSSESHQIIENTFQVMDGETNLNNIDTFIKQFLTDFFDITLLNAA